jgi:hypothetical protein
LLFVVGGGDVDKGRRSEGEGGVLMGMVFVVSVPGRRWDEAAALRINTIEFILYIYSLYMR